MAENMFSQEDMDFFNNPQFGTTVTGDNQLFRPEGSQFDATMGWQSGGDQDLNFGLGAPMYCSGLPLDQNQWLGNMDAPEQFTFSNPSMYDPNANLSMGNATSGMNWMDIAQEGADDEFAESPNAWQRLQGWWGGMSPRGREGVFNAGSSVLGALLAQRMQDKRFNAARDLLNSPGNSAQQAAVGRATQAINDPAFGTRQAMALQQQLDRQRAKSGGSVSARDAQLVAGLAGLRDKELNTLRGYMPADNRSTAANLMMQAPDPLETLFQGLATTGSRYMAQGTREGQQKNLADAWERYRNMA